MMCEVVEKVEEEPIRLTALVFVSRDIDKRVPSGSNPGMSGHKKERKKCRRL